MTKKTVWAQTLVCNEENYIWFAIMSVIDYVDKILIWDTGSTDNTVEIIKKIVELKKDKIEFQEKGKVDAMQWTKMHQAMLEKTESDWFIILDGDEVWWDSSIKSLVDLINNSGDALDSIVSPYYNIVGDIYHYQEEEAGRYHIDDRIGHINIRAVNRKIPGLHKEKPLGQDGFYDIDGVLLQERDPRKRKFLNSPYMHFTNMQRSAALRTDKNTLKRSFKHKYEIGKSFRSDFKFPEVFYQPYPEIVPSPWKKMSTSFFAKAAILTLPRKLKRRIVKGGSGY